ncbi:MAG: VacJ family lipoprotein [Myxococcota bacterium]|nr:VacJ family lipoprotein [Myxococcota bacterium]
MRGTRNTWILGMGLGVLLVASPGSFAFATESNSLDSDSVPADDPFYGERPVEDPYGFDDEADALFDDEFDLEADAPPGFPDPFERFNRGALQFNNFLDRFVLDPITIGYRVIFPEFVRRSINRVFDNVNSTQTLVNDIFQLEWKDAGVTTARLLVNSTIGIGGILDPAERFGLERHVSDFGQTLAIAGTPSGPYLVLPILGPSDVRDGLGLGVDAIFHPTFYLLGGTDVLFFSGSSGLTERARHYEEFKALQESSIDFYAALRSGFYQNRQAQIWNRRESRRPEGGRVETAQFNE